MPIFSFPLPRDIPSRSGPELAAAEWPMDCAICLTPLSPLSEAYLLPACYHCFHHACIMQWTQQQLLHPPATTEPQQQLSSCSAPPLCPLCRRPYSAIIYECIDRTFKCHEIEAGKGIFPECPLPRLLHLSAAQQRRRSMYMRWQEQEGAAGAPLDLRQRSRQLRHSPDSAALSEFLTRELQAILLQEDVELVLQHVLGTMRSSSSSSRGGACRSSGNASSQVQRQGLKPSTSSSSSSSSSCKRPRHLDPEPGSQQRLVAGLAAGVDLFLHAHSAAFAQEVYRFVESGLSVRAYDEASLVARQSYSVEQQQSHDSGTQATESAPQGGAGRAEEEQGHQSSMDGSAGVGQPLQVDPELCPTSGEWSPDWGPGHSFGLLGED